MFYERTANKMSISKRKLVFGIAVNDADYITSQKINGKQLMCPYYVKWLSMLTRCYSERFHKKNPTYKDCKVCDEWLIFSNFKLWMQKQDWKGKELDKDLLFQGNKIYSPEMCLFLNRQINTLLNERGAFRRLYPIGVTFSKEKQKFRAYISIRGITKSLGYFATQELTHKAYSKAKDTYIKKVASEQNEPVRSALLRYKFSIST